MSLRILGAMNLPPLDTFAAKEKNKGCRKVDAFVRVTLDGVKEVFCTEVRKKTLDPIWNTEVEFEAPAGCESVILWILHGEPDFKEEPLGHVTLWLADFCGKSEVEKHLYDLY